MGRRDAGSARKEGRAPAGDPIPRRGLPLARRFLGLLLGRRRPITSGRLTLSGLRRPVLVRRDGWGIPHIEAENDGDAWFALGFCHGQDRAFQLEFLARAARGTLSEMVGPRALPFDRIARRIGFHRAAVRQLEAADADMRQAAEAYSEGVTRGAREGSPARAHEFVLLRSRPSAYSAADTRAVLNLMSFALASNWDCELVRMRVLEADGPDALRALDPTYPEHHPVASPPGGAAGPAVDGLSGEVDVFLELLGTGGGSNNWALSPSRTATGRPILANDPHLPPTTPPQWYLAHVRTPSWEVAGASFVGTPSFPLGHNGTIAWGLTAGMIDNTDLFVEEIGPDGAGVREGDAFVPCTVLEERIRVRGGEDIIEKVLVTPRGPIISPALEGVTRALSLRATWLEPLPLRGFLSAPRARGFEDLRGAFADWPVMSASLVCAGTDGQIGWQLAGLTPRREPGHGLLPRSGCSSGAGWKDGFIPFDDMPRLRDPDAGFVASANQKPVPDGQAPYLGADWIDGFRMVRICEALAARSDWDVEGCQALQMDRESVPWREMRDAVLAAPVSDPATRLALELLRRWDGKVTEDSPAACIFEHFVVEMVRRTIETKAPRSASWLLGRTPGPLVQRGMLSLRRVGHLSRLLRDQPAGWFPRPWPEEIADALGTVVRRLEAARGTDTARWAWGARRMLVFKHPLGSSSRLLSRAFDVGGLQAGGDTNTVAQAAVDPFDPGASPFVAPSLRAVMDVGLWERSRFALAGGQSGNPCSPHYDDQLSLWEKGQGVPIAWSRHEVEEAARETLELLPAIEDGPIPERAP